MKALVFGVFDRFHKGHEYFLLQAKMRSSELIVVVTVPEIVELLKKRLPDDSLEDRMDAVRRFDSTLTIVAGDSTLGEWVVLKTHQPDIVFLGYDQQGIAKELERLGAPYEFLDAFEPERYKSSLMRDNIR